MTTETKINTMVNALQVAHDVLESAGIVAQPLYPDGTLVIINFDRGWTAVGRWYQTGQIVEMREAKIIRRYYDGLAKLAAEGPDDKTVLESLGTIRAYVPHALPCWACDEAKW